MLLKACLNGAREPGAHPALPVGAVDLAADARACVAEGAGAIHLH
ncbi:MAG: 3-keto-5-aminohexanoate cleavage protein, partial [Actinomycetota bacterium]|nr:3-keto-5-aminohexanoate cleavage protein [Actinomycetota bacterium]